MFSCIHAGRQETARRPLTFALTEARVGFGVAAYGALGEACGAAAEWIHAAAPYRLEDNPDTLLDRTDIVMVDAWPLDTREPQTRTDQEILGVKGDVQGFENLYDSIFPVTSGEFSAVLAGRELRNYARGGHRRVSGRSCIAFNGVTLLSMAVDFQTLEMEQVERPTVSAAWCRLQHDRRLPPQTVGRFNAGCGRKTREEVVRWSNNEYALALGKAMR